MNGLIGLDWGTSSLRAYCLDDSGNIRATRDRAWGIRQLPDGGFAAALADITADWPPLPMLACGMVGSRQGWREAAYVEAPAQTSRLARALTSTRTADGRMLHIVPGMHNARGPDVMRGEETQLAGALAMRPDLASRSTWILPGTHSKWASVREGAIADFMTVMTGELFAVLCRHSILGATDAPDTSADPNAFDRGLARARDSGAAAAMSQLFSTRALVLDDKLAPAAVGDYLSGLLIGEEFRSMLASNRFDSTEPLQLIGDDVLCRRYLHAATQFGLSVADPIADAAAHGLWHIAELAGLPGASPTPPRMESPSC